MPLRYLENRLKEASQLTGASWATWLEQDSDRWELRATYKLSQPQRAVLVDFLGQPSLHLWLQESLSGKSVRFRSGPTGARFQGIKMFVFPDQVTRRVILVGAEKLTAVTKRLWSGVAQGGSGRSFTNIDESTTAVSTDFELGIPYYLPQALDQILNAVIQTVNPQGGWLAIHSGDILEVKAAINCPDFIGKRLSIESNPLFRQFSQVSVPQTVSKDQVEWAMVPRTSFKASTRVWAALPLVIGHRLIGLIALWREFPFQHDEWEQLVQMAVRATPSVEGNITFTDITNHLQRMALLNDFALTVSSAFDLEQIAQRVFALLQRAFETNRINLFVLLSDGSLLHHYYEGEGRIILQTLSVESDPIRWPVEKGEIYRAEMLSSNHDYEPVYPDSKAALLVPLKYRRQVIGALGLESTRQGAFTIYDEHLLVVIASHLAGLIENGRLRQEAESRARNLSLIHEVVEHVVGLTDVRQVGQIAAELMARNFAYEMAVVALFEEPERILRVVGIGGSVADVVQQGLHYMNSADQGGITARVAVTGQSMLVTDVNQDPIYRPIPDWDAGSEMCVALREGDRILGVVDVESQRKNAFTQNDLLVLESLAGILSNVISSADQYQKLQATVDQLQKAREELQERIASQRVAESRLVQAAKLAAVGEMAAGIAHELNNPLTTVCGFAELVMNEMPAESPSRTDLELVLHEANRARGVVRRLLDFARQSESTRVRSDLNEIVTDVLALVNHLLHTSGVEVSTDLKEHLPWVSVDRNQIKQVILNLIHNALHAMPAGGKLFLATELRKREKRDWMTIRIRDTGMGIPPEHIERIFEPFFTTRSKDGGTGLGLSVSYGIVADHGGFIDVESRLGRGSTFTVWLPVENE